MLFFKWNQFWNDLFCYFFYFFFFKFCFHAWFVHELWVKSKVCFGRNARTLWNRIRSFSSSEQRRIELIKAVVACTVTQYPSCHDILSPTGLQIPCVTCRFVLNIIHLWIMSMEPMSTTLVRRVTLPLNKEASTAKSKRRSNWILLPLIAGNPTSCQSQCPFYLYFHKKKGLILMDKFF